MTKTEYNNFQAANENQANKQEKLKVNSQNLEKSNAESIKLDAIDQYGQRQNLEFQGVPVLVGMYTTT